MAGMIFFTAALVVAQQPIATGGDSQPSRPGIFQRSPRLVTDSPTASDTQASPVSLRLASDAEMDVMEDLLQKFVTAFENMNLREVRQVWPTLDKQHATAFKNVFAGLKGISSRSPVLSLQCGVPVLATDFANIGCHETVIYATGRGKTKELGPVRVLIQMKAPSGNWVISDMKGSN